MIDRVPNQCHNLKAAESVLKEECHDMESIRMTETSDWQRMAVPIGLGRRLARNVRIYERKRREPEHH